jgi:hypothetical protein
MGPLYEKIKRKPIISAWICGRGTPPSEFYPTIRNYSAQEY